MCMFFLTGFAVLVVYFVGVWVWDVLFALFSCVVFILLL
jgi:hypothetical protein